jgi:hypothetical protein
MTAAVTEIECLIPVRGVVAVIALDTVAAPAACAALVARLPLVADAYHTKWNGHELFAVLEPLADAPPENLTGSPRPGDVLLFHRDATYRAAPRGLRAGGLGAYAELGLYYGPLARAFGPDGAGVGIRLGRIVAGLEPLAEAARAMRRHGFHPLRLQRRA